MGRDVAGGRRGPFVHITRSGYPSDARLVLAELPGHISSATTFSALPSALTPLTLNS